MPTEDKYATTAEADHSHNPEHWEQLLAWADRGLAHE